MAESNTCCIVLLGSTGSGKSSLANTLFGEDVFQVNHSADSSPKICTSKSKTINGRSVRLVDTPGFFDADPRSTELSPQLVDCIKECAPGPHAIVLVLKVEEYTELEHTALLLTLTYFSEEALRYTTVVFTHGDEMPEGMTIGEWVGQNKDLGSLVQRCGGRCHVIDNKRWSSSQDPYRNNQHQIEQLLKTIDQTVGQNRGKCYTNNILEEFKYSKNAPRSYAQMSMQRVSAGILLGAFLGAIKGSAAWSGENSGKVQKHARYGWLGGVLFSLGAIRKASERWNSPSEAVEDATIFAEKVESLFIQMTKTVKAGKGLADAMRKEEKKE